MKRLERIVMCALLCFSMLITIPMTSKAEVTKKDTTSRDIAIVFDNSGSMYGGEGAWCPATYAIEVFARMMNDQDTLSVYPMNAMEVDGKIYTYDSPLVIKNPDDAKKIRSIKTRKLADDPNTPQKENALDTHIESIPAALKGLAKEKAGEKWLIVTTDGDEFYEDGVGLGTEDTLTRLNEELSKCADSVDTMYLGIGEKAVEPEIVGKYAHAPVKSKNNEIPQKLSEMCNTIFGRNELEVKNNKVEFDIPLSKLIVFIQGRDIDNIKLNGSNGEIKATNTSDTKYSEERADGHSDAKVDKSLQGKLVTYKDLKKGTYTLSYDGEVSSISVYYEPDADLQVDLLNEEGISVANKSALVPGEYTVICRMVDSEGNDISDSKLLGNTKYTLLGMPFEKEESDKPISKKFNLTGGDTFKLDEASVTFLKDYTITKTGEEAGFPAGGCTVSLNVIELKIEGPTSFNMAELAEKGQFKITANLNGSPMTEEQFSNLTFSQPVIIGDSQEGIPCGEIVKGNDFATVKLGYAEGGVSKTQPGAWAVSVDAAYPDGAVEPATPHEFTIIDDIKTIEIKTSIVGEKKYYLLKNIGSDTPIRATVKVDGQNLSREQMDEIVASGGITFTAKNPDKLILGKDIKPVYEESAFDVSVDKGTKSGVHTVTAEIKMPDQDRQRYSGETSSKGKIEIKTMEPWIVILIIIGIILLLAALIAFILTRKILPRNIDNDPEETTFKSGGMAMSDKGVVSYSRKNLIQRLTTDGSLSISSGADNSGTGITTVNIKIKRCARVWDVITNKRRCKAEAVLQNNENTIRSLDLAGTGYTYDNTREAIIDDTEALPSERPVKLFDGANIDISERKEDANGNTKNYSYSTILHLKW